MNLKWPRIIGNRIEMSLTIYVIDRGGDKEKTFKSIEGLGATVIEKPSNVSVSGLNNCDTDWYMIIFTDEHLQDILVKAIPEFMQSGYDYFRFYRIMDNGEKSRYFVNPRLFRKEVILNRHGEPSSEYIGIDILDGYIEHHDNIY
jgi:hypothetical protein